MSALQCSAPTWLRAPSKYEQRLAGGWWRGAQPQPPRPTRPVGLSQGVGLAVERQKRASLSKRKSTCRESIHTLQQRSPPRRCRLQPPHWVCPLDLPRRTPGSAFVFAMGARVACL
eukprot:1999673-Rhodomonas_salina.2